VVLVDTSVWIEVFRRSSGVQLESLVEFDEIVTCLPIIQEVLQGFGAEPAFLRARESMLSLPIVESPLAQGVFLEAADLYRSGRRMGVTIRSSVDCVIAVCAIRHQLEVLHCDPDYDAIARISSLKTRSLDKSSHTSGKRST
jgi:predicted nucleic acid-binding protein